MAFWNEKRRRMYPRLIVAAAVVWTPLLMGYLWINAASNHERYGGDFVVYWSAAKIAQQGRPEDVFDGDAIQQMERTVLPDAPLDRINYPPPILLAVRPLAAAPFPIALVIWTTATLGLFIAVLKVSDMLTIGSVSLGFVAITLNFAFGQNGALSAAILTGGLVLLDRNPTGAGLALGLLCYKPQLAPVLAVYLVYQRRWSVLAGMAATTATLCGVSYVFFRPATWRAFFENIPTAGQTPYLAHLWPKMPTVLSAVQLVGASKELALAAQAIASIIAIAGVISLARGSVPSPLRNAGIVTAALIATPYLFVYDLVCLIPVLAWLLQDGRRHKLTSLERAFAGLTAISPVGVWLLASRTSVQLGPFILLGFLGLILHRARTIPRREASISASRTVGIPYKQGIPVTK